MHEYSILDHRKFGSCVIYILGLLGKKFFFYKFQSDDVAMRKSMEKYFINKFPSLLEES